MAKDKIPPSIKETAFNCPHCGAFTTQYWFKLFPEKLEKNNVPNIPDASFKEVVQQDDTFTAENKRQLFRWYDEMTAGLVFIEEEEDPTYCRNRTHNLFLSKCYNCGKIAVWVHDNIVFPPEKQGVQPNQDLNENIIKDFEEARSIVGLSPRGAAALLRLCIQKLCVQLGEKGENINDDIASLVKKGLNPIVQQSLDIVRVIGNEAVHPGVIDLNDDRDTANHLFGLINTIADQMITHPKTVEKIYGKLPPEKRGAIEKRDGKAK